MSWWCPEEFLRRKKLPFLSIESRPFILQRELFASPWATLRFTLKAPVTGTNRDPGLSYSCHSSRQGIFYPFWRRPFQGTIRWHLPSIRLRSEEHTSELQSRGHLVCRLLLEK